MALPIYIQLSKVETAMKKIVLAVLFVGIFSTSFADIQAPPMSEYNAGRKLARGLSNILYGWAELPATVFREGQHSGQSAEIVFAGIINGLGRTGQRFGFGVYEVVKFRKPVWKDSYRPSYTSINFDPVKGYEEFPPQIGFLSTAGYTRETTY